MVNLTESLLKAISIVADKSAEEAFSDKTIKAIVKKAVSTFEGKYLVTYNSGDFYAYLQSGSTDVYQEGEQIYILVPEGDMGQKKFIIGKVKNEEYSSPKELTSSLLNDYVVIGNNVIIENKYSSNDSLNIKRMQPLTLDSYKTRDYYYCYLKNPENINGLSEEYYNNFNYPAVSVDEEIFSNSAKQAKALLLRAKFKASLDADNIGNYGIIVNIAFADETNPQIDEDGVTTYPPKLVAYVLDASKMTGNPMRFYDYTSQYMIAAFDNQNYLYIDSIVAFSEGFVDQDIDDIDDGVDPYIYIDDLEIIALDEIAAVNGDYKLKLTAPLGNTIKEGRKDNLSIRANVTYLNQDITNNTIFYWGVRDPSITSVSNEYNAKLGSGYRYIENKENELILTSWDLTAAENTFVCVAVYESDIILKTSILIYNNNNKLKITIDSDQGTKFQFNEGNPTLTCLINDKTSNYQDNYSDSAFSFVWSKEDSDFGTILLDKTKSQLETARDQELQECEDSEDGVSSAGRTVTQILSYYSTRISQVTDISYPNGIHGSKIRCTLKNTNTYVTYSCSVYRGGIYVGYGSITLRNYKDVTNSSYYITIENGAQVFQYDEAGIAPNSMKKREPIEILDLVATFYSPQGAEVTPKRVRWIVPQEDTLISIPLLGLQTDAETGERYYSGNIYPLNIKEKYDNNCSNNQIIAVVTHADGVEYRQSTNLLFTKIGEIGTNGTETVVKIDETVNVPSDECLTMIKPANKAAFYNSGNSINDPVLEANLYTNNEQVLGYSTKWTIAGSSSTQSRNYRIETSNDNCIVKYDADSRDELNTRIVRAQVNLQGKYFYSFYSIPTIEYSAGYSYQNYPIKIIRNDTLKTILYDSNGTNPSYNENQGVHVELKDWSETGFLKWNVEGGLQENDEYKNPNLFLSRSPKAKIGSTVLEINSDIESIQSNILRIQDTGKNCANNATANIKEYINRFLVDVEKTSIDNLLSTSNKITILWNRLGVFLKDAPDQENIYIRTVYEQYSEFFNQIREEYELCQEVNKKCTEIYNKVQTTWNSEWPNVITESRLCIASGVNIKTIQELIQKYQKAYDDRSNSAINAEKMPVRTATFNTQFQNIIGTNGNTLNGLDKIFNDYLNSSGNSNIQINSILIEYGKVLTTYLNMLINETQSYFDDTYPVYYNENGEQVNFKNKIIDKYHLAYEDWSSNNVIGKNIYDVIISAEEIAANVYDNVRKLYQYYQALYLNVKKYQITEESKTLNAWSAILKGNRPDLLNQIYVIPDNTFNGLYMNNNVVGTVFTKEENTIQEVAKIYIPIIMTLNTYELASLNGWDGTNVEVGDNHILTPQIGAGIKDDITNTFTGMVMGVVDNTSTNDSSKLDKINKVGLIGYSNGKQSIFIDSKTGRASFGLPEDDEQTNEGRIELVPGGVSKIGNWKIGNRFLYNIVNGNYEVRSDSDARNTLSANKIMVPHDKHGIVLSSDKPYIHVKGEVYEDDNLKGINYKDEYNNINPGDSLELRIDPGDKSLFSIVQHTAGFGSEDIDDLLFGYKTSGSDTMVTIKDYIANKNTDETIQAGKGAEYYIYKLVTDANGNYKPYYKQETGNSLTKSSWTTTTSLPVSSGSKLLSSSLPENCFKRTIEDSSFGAVFNINDETGVIAYNPSNLVWDTDSNHISGNEVIGFSNDNGWNSSTVETLSSNFTVSFKYSKDMTGTPITKDLQIGQIKNTTNFKIYKVRILGYTLHRTLTGMLFNDPVDNYVQFYIVSNSGDGINKALLTSEMISLWDNQTNANIDISSLNNKSLAKNTSYWLKMHVYVNNYAIDANCSCKINNTFSSYYTPPTPPYGTIRITNTTSGWTSFTTSNGSAAKISGTYSLYQSGSKWGIRFKISGSQQTNNSPSTVILDTDNLAYDFVLWRLGTDTAESGGRAFNGENAKFFTSTSTVLDSLSTDKILNYKPSAANPWCISFYPEGYCTTETIEYNTTNENGSSSENSIGTSIDTYTVTATPKWDASQQQYVYDYSYSSGTVLENENDNVQSSVNEQMNVIVKYKLTNSSIITMTNRKVYSINWNDWANKYNTANAAWELKLTDLSFGQVLGFVPNDSSKLCVEGAVSSQSLQGTPYARTYWDDNNKQRVRFFKDYYDRVNVVNKNKNQYGYIDIDDGNNVYYKYAKTLLKAQVNKWFTSSLSDVTHSTTSTTINNISVWDWIDISVLADIFKEAIYWKEFIRVGLDENGRFFSAGLQDKKTYSRTGIIHSFGKIPNLYGQEIRAESSSGTYIPIIKIFAQKSNSSIGDTTYITRSQDDDGSISIRTAGDSHYLELATSETSTNDTNTIPNRTGYIRISHDNGVQIWTKKDVSLEADNSVQITSQSNITTYDSNGIISKISNGYKWTQTSKYVVSSVSATTPDLACGVGLGGSKNSKVSHFRITAVGNEKNPSIQLQVGNNNAGLIATKSYVKIASDEKHYIVINSNKGDSSGFRAKGMGLYFRGKEGAETEKVALENNGAVISISPIGDGTYHSIALNPNNSTGSLIVSNKVSITCPDGLSVNKNAIVGKNIYSNHLYSNGDIYIGYSNNKETLKSSIYLYKDEKKNYLLISPDQLQQLFDWYNTKRWGIGCYGNTVVIRNVDNKDNPEGSLSGTTYKWNTLTFSKYTGTG